MRQTVLAAMLALVPAVAAAQSSPFLPDPLFQKLVNEISGDRAFESIRHLTHYHRTGGSKDFFAAAEWIRTAAEAAGLQDVRLVRQAWSGHGWSCRSGQAWLVKPEEVRLADYAEVAVSIADHSRTTHVTAPLVDVGAGATEADYRDRDVKGRIVLASGSVTVVQREAVWKRGALGIVSHMTQRLEMVDAPDQVAWGRLEYEARGIEGVPDATPATFAIMISPRKGRSLQKRLAEAAVEVKVDIEAAYPERQEQAYVEGWIHGGAVADQQVVLTAHVQEEMTSANDDGSGCASLLEIGRALSRLIEEKRIPRPRRDIRLLWVNEFSSLEQMFREDPKQPRRMLLAINQDMVGARQSWGGRVQHASRLPWSLPHPLEDVLESVLAMLGDGNTEYLTTRGTSLPARGREIVAVKGSREPYHARMVPYYGHSDHHAFTPARVGVPATGLVNWPDDWIHSTGDDLPNVDATQLERNAVVVAAVSLYFAALDDEGAAALAPYVAARGRARIAANVATAVAHQREGGFREARILVQQSCRKEQDCLAALKRLSPRGRAAEYATQAASRLADALPDDLQALERAYTAITGKNPPNIDLDADEKAMAGKVFVPVTDIGTWQDAMAKLKPTDGLHPMMRFEAFNFSDGRRSAWEVYEAVAAEALAAGGWYYGRVRPKDVLETLERAADAGAFTLKARK